MTIMNIRFSFITGRWKVLHSGGEAAFSDEADQKCTPDGRAVRNWNYICTDNDIFCGYKLSK